MASLADIMSAQLAKQLHTEEEDAINAAIEASMRETAPAEEGETAHDAIPEDDEAASLRFAMELQRRLDAGIEDMPSTTAPVAAGAHAGTSLEFSAHSVPPCPLTCRDVSIIRTQR
jgi:hypothetical protein